MRKTKNLLDVEALTNRPRVPVEPKGGGVGG